LCYLCIKVICITLKIMKKFCKGKNDKTKSCKCIKDKLVILDELSGGDVCQD
jgi:hypothetical protein